jgi:dsDNA-binding SOS-regulon protein
MFDKKTGVRERMQMLSFMSQNEGDSFSKMESTEASTLVPTLRRDSN